MPRVVAVVPTRAAGELLEACAAALAAQDPRPHLVAVLDGAPLGAVAALQARHPELEVEVLHQPRPRGFAAAANAGLRRALALEPEWVLLLNDDVRLEPGCLAALLTAGEDARGPRPVGAATPLLLDPQGRVDGFGLELNRLGQGRDRARGRSPEEAAPLGADVVAASGAALLLRARALRSLAPDGAPLDEGYGFYYEDVDLGLALRDAGYRVVAARHARARHLGSATLGRGSARQAFFLARNQARLVLKTFPTARLPLAAPLALGRLALRPLEAWAARRPAQALATAAALPAVLAEAPRLLRRRRPMRAETFALLRPCLTWPRSP